MTDWYHHDPAQGRVGPLTAAQLRTRYRERRVQRDTLVWREGLREWQPLERCSEELQLDDVVQDASQPPPLPPPSRRMPAARVWAGGHPAQPRASSTTEERHGRMGTWYYSDGERNRHGPVGASDLAELHRHGQLAPDTLVWRQGLEQWQPWHAMAGEVVPGAGRPAADSASFATASADAPAHVSADPYAVAEPRSPYAPPNAPLLRERNLHFGGEVVHAGFWKRVAASLIDSVLLAIIGGMAGAVIGGVMGAGGAAPITIGLTGNLFSIVLAACYGGWFYASHTQATPGKMAIGIKVVRGSGERIGFWRGFARYFAQIPGALVLGIGYAMAGFTARKQALHDMICDTLVVDKWAYTESPERQRHELGTLTIVVLVLGGLLLLGFFALVALMVSLASAK